MPKIKELSKYNGSSWETGVPIGADASNVDVTVSGGSTKSLQTVLGTPSNSTDLQTQINSKVGTTGDGSSTTVTGISNYDTDSGETSKDLVTDVVASNSNSQATLWSKFNRFRRRVGNKFGDYFATANLVTSTTGVTTSGTDSEAYTAKALNDYFANVIGYASESDLPSSADTVASQLSSLNNKTTNAYIYYDSGAGWTYNVPVGFSFYRFTNWRFDPIENYTCVLITFYSNNPGSILMGTVPAALISKLSGESYYGVYLNIYSQSPISTKIGFEVLYIKSSLR